MIGSTILHYKILEKLGEGGMGEVFKAQDTKLDRFVALKFLTSNVVSSEEEKARFIQEAKAASSMNHPNVCTIYDIQEHDGQLFIVMEFVDGKTLKDKKDSISEKQKLELSVQVAEGLAAAHEKGIVHRDIKPENIMIRKDGIAQIMDFGLAKLYSDKNASRLTKVGTTMGTLGYMSPEQVQGLDVDHRTDIFSFGVVLYEMFAGESPFKGMHETAIMYEIVNVDAPPISTVKEGIDTELDEIILECLGKDKDYRCQSAKELAKDLRKVKKSSGHKKSRVYNVNTAAFKTQTGQAPISNSSGSIAIEAFNRRFELRKLFPMFFALIFIAAAVFAYLYFNQSKTFSNGAIQFELNSPNGTKFEDDVPQISPDGKVIAFTAADSTGKSMIWLRPVESIKANRVEGTEEARLPFWSYDGKYLGFFQNEKMQRVNLSTGAKQVICDAEDGFGAIWNNDNQIIFMPTFFSPLYKVNAGGGIPVQLTSLDNSIGEEHHFPSQFLPDNIHFLYTAGSRNQGQNNIYVGSLNDNSKIKVFGNDQTIGFNDKAFFISPDYLLYLKDRNVVVRKFNLSSYKLEGEERTILNNVQTISVTGNLLIASEGNSNQISNLVLYDRKGNILSKKNNLGLFVEMYPSPDGNSFAYHRIHGPDGDNKVIQDIWIYNRQRDFSTPLTTDDAADIAPVWSPDGKTIVYSSSPDSVYNIYEKNIEIDAKPKLLFKNNIVVKSSFDWSKDGKYILLGVFDPETKADIWLMPMFGDEKPFPNLQTKFNEYAGSFSPDSKWLAYSSDETGRPEVYIQNFPEPGKKYVVSTEGGRYPKWSKDGNELFYISTNGYMTAVEIKLKGKPEIGKAKKLFKVNHLLPYPNMYEVLNNGQSFLFNNWEFNSKIKSLRVIVNWRDLLNDK